MASSADAFDQTDYNFEVQDIDQMDQNYTHSDAEAEHNELVDLSTQDGHSVINCQGRILPDLPA